MTEWVREGIDGRSLKATLRLYLVGLMLLGPVAAVLAVVLGIQTSFVTTPLLVLILVAVEYAVSYRTALYQYFEKLRRNFPLAAEDKQLWYAWTSEEILPNELGTNSSLVELLRDIEVIEHLSMDDVDSLIIALKDEDPKVRYRAVRGLLRIGDLRAVEPLLNALGDHDGFVRSEVSFALWEIAMDLPSTQATLKRKIKNALHRVKRVEDEKKDGRKASDEGVRKRA